MADNDFLDWIDESKTFKADVDYQDATPTPPLVITPSSDLMAKAQDSAKQLETKMYGHDVRASLAQWIMLGGYMYNQGVITLEQFQAALNSFEDTMEDRQVDVEKRQTTVEDRFKEVIANATVDSELINARNSTICGKFPTLDGRLENIEQMLVKATTHGIRLNIPKMLTAGSTIALRYEEYPLGIVPIGNEPSGMFGGGNKQNLSAKVISTANGNSVVEVAGNVIDVGGRNLIHDTSFEQGLWKTAFGNPSFEVTNDGNLKFSISDTDQHGIGTPLEPVEMLKPYTLSFKMRGRGPFKPYIMYNGIPNLSIYKEFGREYPMIDSATEFVDIKYTFTPANRDITKQGVFAVLTSEASGNWLEIKKYSLKLEQGDIATPYASFVDGDTFTTQPDGSCALFSEHKALYY